MDFLNEKNVIDKTYVWKSDFPSDENFTPEKGKELHMVTVK